MELVATAIVIVLGILGFAWMWIKKNADDTKQEWDDSIVDMVEGLSNELGFDPDELARKSTGKLKKRVIKEAVKQTAKLGL